MKHVIIGAGAAGIKAAETIRTLRPDDEIVVISSDEYVHSRCMLHKYLSHERNEETLSFIDGAFFEKNNIRWIKGLSVRSVDPSAHCVVLTDGTKQDYDKLLIATGADSFIPPIGELRTAVNVFGLRDLSDAQEIDALAQKDSKALVIGSGLVGLDAAYAFSERGISVTIVEMAESILPMQLDSTAAAAYQKLFEEHGCRFILGHKAVTTVTNAAGKMERVRLDDGTEIDCDIIIVAAGVRASVTFLEGSGIETTQGVTVNKHMQTSDKDVYAAGDVTALSGIWPNATAQGKIAAYGMCGMEKAYEDTYCMKNTINFFGLTTLSLGNYKTGDGDEVFTRECRDRYERVVVNNGHVVSVILQGKIDYCGFWQYLIKNECDISACEKDVFRLSYADFFSVREDGQYAYKSLMRS